MPAGVRPCLALALAAACAGITYTLPESESANTRDSATCTFVIFYDTPISKMAAANVGHAPSLAMSTQAFDRLRPTRQTVQTVGQRTHRPTGRRPLVRRHTQRA